MGRSEAVCRQVLRSEELDGVHTSRVASHHHRSLACVFYSALICLLFVVCCFQQVPRAGLRAVPAAAHAAAAGGRFRECECCSLLFFGSGAPLSRDVLVQRRRWTCSHRLCSPFVLVRIVIVLWCRFPALYKVYTENIQLGCK